MLKPYEVEVVEWVARLVEPEFKVIPAQWTERDWNDGSGLSVDVTFENPGLPRPIAVEVTRLRDDFENNWSKARLRKFEAHVGAFAKAKRWAGCLIALHRETSLKTDLAPAVERMIEWMAAAELDALRPGAWSPGYVSMDLFARIQQVRGRDFVKECSDARLKGVNEIQRLSSDGVLVMWIDECSDHRSLQRPLVRAFMTKASRSLGIAKDRGYVTILAVDVERTDTPNYLREGVRVPDFAPKIDHLFLFVRTAPGGDLDAVFYANRTREGRRLKRLDLVEQTS